MASSRFHRRPGRRVQSLRPGAIGAVVARFVHTEEVTGSNPVSPTHPAPCRAERALGGDGVSGSTYCPHVGGQSNSPVDARAASAGLLSPHRAAETGRNRRGPLPPKRPVAVPPWVRSTPRPTPSTGLRVIVTAAWVYTHDQRLPSTCARGVRWHMQSPASRAWRAQERPGPTPCRSQAALHAPSGEVEGRLCVVRSDCPSWQCRFVRGSTSTVWGVGSFTHETKTCFADCATGSRTRAGTPPAHPPLHRGRPFTTGCSPSVAPRRHLSGG